MAQALGLAPAVLARPLQRPAGLAHRRTRLVVPDEGRAGRLPRALRDALRLPIRTGVRVDELTKLDGRFVVSAGDRGSRRRTSWSRPARTTFRACPRSRRSSIRGSSSSTLPGTGIRPSSGTGTRSSSAWATREPRSPSSCRARTPCWSPGGSRTRSRSGTERSPVGSAFAGSGSWLTTSCGSTLRIGRKVAPKLIAEERR